MNSHIKRLCDLKGELSDCVITTDERLFKEFELRERMVA